MAVDQFQNAYVTKLRESCSVDADVIFVDTPPMINQGTLTIDFSNQTKREIIHFTGVDGYKLTGVTRGLEDTTAQSHTVGTDIRQNVTAGMMNNNNITTDKIVDHAVTKEKIDMSTFNDGYSWRLVGIATTTEEQSGIICKVPIHLEDYMAIKIMAGGQFSPNGTTNPKQCNLHCLDVNQNAIHSGLNEHWSWQEKAGQGSTDGRGIGIVNTATQYDSFIFKSECVLINSTVWPTFKTESGRAGGEYHRWSTIARINQNSNMVRYIAMEATSRLEVGAKVIVWGIPKNPDTNGANDEC